MDYTKAAVAAAAIPVAWILFKKLRRSDIADIRGPDTSWSFLLGMTILVHLGLYLNVLILLQVTSSLYRTLSGGLSKSSFWTTMEALSE